MKNIKVVFFGRGEAGKSSLIAKIAPKSTNVEYKGMTVALDFGTIVHNDTKFHLFGTPGQDRWEKIREVVAYGVQLGVLVLDASTTINEDDRKIMEEIKKYDVPFVVFINKRDIAMENIDDTIEISRKLLIDIMKETVVFGSAEDGRNIDKLLDTLEQKAKNL